MLCLKDSDALSGTGSAESSGGGVVGDNGLVDTVATIGSACISGDVGGWTISGEGSKGASGAEGCKVFSASGPMVVYGKVFGSPIPCSGPFKVGCASRGVNGIN